MMETKALKRALTYIPITLFIGLFSFIYELNGHGVYSNYMIFAFVPSLVGGVLFWLCVMAINKRKGLHNSGKASDISKEIPSTLFVNLWTALIATLSVGMIFKGALDIYGTSSKLTNIYWIVSIILFILSIISILPKKQK